SGKGRRHREGNDERVNDINGQGNDQGLGDNGVVEGVNGNVKGFNGGVGGAPNFSTIIAQQLQNLLPTMLAQVGNQGNTENQNGGGTGRRVGKGGGKGRRPREGNDERVDDLSEQGNDQGMGANGGIEGVNGNIKGANGGAPEFLTIIAQQLHDLLPAMLAQVGNQGNVGNQNGNVVNENVQENVRNVSVNGNRVGCSYKEFLACNHKEYDGKGGAVV
nr:hypothetical protein [Tanacetum cinerariifolium]